MRSSRFMKETTKMGRRIFRMGDGYVVVSHVGGLDRITKNKRWCNRSYYRIDTDARCHSYVYHAAVLDQDSIVVPFDFSNPHKRTGPGNIGVFTWASPDARPTAYWPTQKPHDDRGVRSVATQPQILYTGGYDHTLALWKFNEDKKVVSTTRLRSAHTSKVDAVAGCSGRNWLCSAGTLPGKRSERIAVLDVDTDRIIRLVPGSYPVCQMQEHPDSPNLILCESVAIMNQFMLLDLRARRSALTFGTTTVLGDTKLKPEALTKGAIWADLIAKGIGDYTIRVWDIRNTKLFQDVKIADGGSHSTVSHLLLGKDGLVALRNDAVIFVDWTLEPKSKK
ncbi:hypothetical protein CALCODRAFT_516572 [Calocera cornea HHB12733]|uniref:WD40 repeat-like protein n=1 Tax=Calocera cornea HHB12733 TaxID=1353952 RepID=A0A165H3X3_9BASI|nr:hypothetical protein CALCODRAFT_516572 [Calocera cornea HHB12733]